MAVNISVFDLDNYPSNPKTVTVDLSELVPYGNNGEDTWVLSAVTSATASGGATIQRLYIKDARWGWARSSGLAPGPYSVTELQKHLKIAIDEDISDALEIELDTSLLSLGGDTVANDIQTKLNAAAKAGGDKAGNLSYLNAAVSYENGRFKIVSGSAAKNYVGSNETSVSVSDGVTTTGLAAELGFDIPFTSRDLAGTEVKQTSVASSYTAGATTLSVAATGVVSDGDCIGLTDGANTEFRGVESSVGNTVTLSSGFTNSYATGALVQVATLKDPSGEPPPAYSKIDDFIKFAISSIVNQINFGG